MKLRFRFCIIRLESYNHCQFFKENDDMGIAEEIEKLNGLRQSGAISEDEYQKAKETALAESGSGSEKAGTTLSKISSDANQWSMFIHLSQLCGYIAPVAGFVVPIVLWQIKKDESDIIDKHGKIVANWILTELIYGIVFGLLCIILIGIPLIITLAILGIIFPIIGGLKANAGEVWRYPMSITFFRSD